MRRRSVVWLAATGVVLLAVLFGVRSWLLRDRTDPVDVDRVVERYRDAPAATAPRRDDVPAAGVYEYATTGGEQAELLGTSRHDYPATTTITIVPGGCGFTATWEALDLRSERWTLCRDGDALRPVRFDDGHAFYGRTDRRTYRCSGGALALEPGADPAAIDCARDGTTRTDRVRDAGTATVDVGDRTVATIRLRIATTMRGETEGTATVDLWLARDTGLPVRVRADVANKSDTPIGTQVSYRERYDLRLRALRPRQ
jgi:hypothetical protein